jgi:acetyl-CoA carboxylase carboxyl transferase subunit alpha
MSENSVSVEPKFSEQLARAWSVVEKSRHPQRPYALDYIHQILSDFEELKGDRVYGEDPALVAGMGLLPAGEGREAQTVFVLGNQKGRKTKEKIERNFGMARPEGYRKAVRVMELAERFKKPLLTFIDTPGAFPGISSEERGQSVAIAESIRAMASMKVPSVGIVIGEGGSGGALAIGVTDRLLMLENSIYSVISPESCAAILWGNSGESKRAALALKLSASETFKLGLCDEIVAEPGEGAHETFVETSVRIAQRVRFHFSALQSLSLNSMMAARFTKFREIDRHLIGTGGSNESHG